MELYEYRSCKDLSSFNGYARSNASIFFGLGHESRCGVKLIKLNIVCIKQKQEVSVCLQKRLKATGKLT